MGMLSSMTGKQYFCFLCIFVVTFCECFVPKRSPVSWGDKFRCGSIFLDPSKQLMSRNNENEGKGSF